MCDRRPLVIHVTRQAVSQIFFVSENRKSAIGKAATCQNRQWCFSVLRLRYANRTVLFVARLVEKPSSDRDGFSVHLLERF